MLWKFVKGSHLIHQFKFLTVSIFRWYNIISSSRALMRKFHVVLNGNEVIYFPLLWKLPIRNLTLRDIAVQREDFSNTSDAQRQRVNVTPQQLQLVLEKFPSLKILMLKNFAFGFGIYFSEMMENLPQLEQLKFSWCVLRHPDTLNDSVLSNLRSVSLKRNVQDFIEASKANRR